MVMGVSKPTEMTIRDLLQKELRKRGVKVVPEFSVLTPVGRMMPDMLLSDGAAYVVETKLGAEAKLLDAMVRLYDYSKYVTEARGAFAVLFPEELRRPWPHEMIMKIAVDPKLEYTVTAVFKDLRPSQRFSGNLFEAADWLAGHVLRAPVVEADTGFAIRVLRDAVDYITASVRQLHSKELEDIFGGKSVFENILQYKEGRYPLEAMRHAATYLLVNQLLFYHVLSRVDKSFRPIEEEKIRRPSDLAMYFKPVLKRNYSSIFGFDVASRLPENATEVVKKVVMVVKALAPEKIRHDLLGKVFHELIPFEVRKSVAAFYTNNEAAEILAQLAIDKPDAKVIDLAVGSGTLLVAAYRRKRELLQKEKGTFTLEDHKRFLEQDLTGIDIMPFAAHLAVVHLSLQSLLYETEKVRIAVWDSTELKPEQTIPAISRELKSAYKRPTLEMFMEGRQPKEKAYTEKGAITLEGMGGEQIQLEQADLVIMNPPFTRQERLPAKYKTALINRLQGYEDYLHGQLGLYGHFVFLADRFTKKDGKIALVLPATILRVRSAEGVRKLLIQRYSIKNIITAWERAAFSEGAQFREILLVAKKTKAPNNSKCCITSLKKLPRSIEEAKEYADKIKSVSRKLNYGDVYSDDTMVTRAISQNELRKNVKNVYTFISTYNIKVSTFLEKIFENASQKLTPFKDYLKQVDGKIFEFDYRPPYHGAFLVERFRAIKKVDEWVIKGTSDVNLIVENRFTKEELKVPLKKLQRGLRRPARTDRMDLTQTLDYIITAKFKEIGKILKNPSAVQKWRKYVQRRLANLIISRRFDISATGTKLITYYSSIPTVGVDMWSIKGIPDEDAKILALWFNSTPNLLSTLIYRTETRGAWMKIHEYTLKDLLVIDPRTLSPSDRARLLKLFDRTKNETFTSLLEQLKTKFPHRVEIDKTILKVLGFGDDEINRLLNYLYPALANEIEQLKTL
ncbi:MAG: N-6 DNA methylase, partial [Thermoproteota archaeon]|nr:N-6 DNA methylase [Thermoproteota archaeon]